MGVMQVITQAGLIRPLIARFGERRTLIYGQSALLIFYFGMAFVGGPIVLTALLAPFAFGQGVSEPSLQSLVTRFGGLGASGELLGLYQSARSLALIVGPIWAGLVYEAIDPRATFVVGGLISVMALGLGIWLLRMPIPEKRTGNTIPAPARSR
jgi:MFS family permease